MSWRLQRVWNWCWHVGVVLDWNLELNSQTTKYVLYEVLSKTKSMPTTPAKFSCYEWFCKVWWHSCCTILGQNSSFPIDSGEKGLSSKLLASQIWEHLSGQGFQRPINYNIIGGQWATLVIYGGISMVSYPIKLQQPINCMVWWACSKMVQL